MDLREYERLRKEKSYRRVIKEDKKELEIYQMLPYYEGCILLGDSMAESILDFRLLRKNNVIAKRGRCIDMIDEDLEKVYVLEPKILFMEFGKNDILHFHKNVNAFIQVYRQKIKKIKELLPDVEIYINSIIPMHSDYMEKIGGIEILNRFNEGLCMMCESLQLTFIDNGGLMNWIDDEYEFDGIHPKYPYYAKWLKHMAEIAGVYE